MATSKPPRTSTTRSTCRTGSRATTGTTGTTARRPRRRGSRPSTRRRVSASLPTTVGAALGTLVVTSLLDASWPVRIGLIALVLVAGLGYLAWRRRSEVASASQLGGLPNPSAAQGDPTHE